ncbi:unnamed protein product, partial [Rotaria sp. Silwood1]
VNILGFFKTTIDFIISSHEDVEQITMDIESYRQVMKDVMIMKTILHQLDRLLKHSNGINMTNSMISLFHESMISSRHYSSSINDANLRYSIDKNLSYNDLVKYKYSSQTPSTFQF